MATQAPFIDLSSIGGNSPQDLSGQSVGENVQQPVSTPVQAPQAIPAPQAAQPGSTDPNAILAGAQSAPQSPLAGAGSIVAPTATPQTHSLLDRLITGLVAGATGGAASNPTQANGGVAGAQAAQQVMQQQQQADQAKLDQQQQNFKNQLAANQDNREQQLNQARIAQTNLTNYQMAHQIANYPLEDQEAYQKFQSGTLDFLRKGDPTATFVAIDGGQQGLTDYWAAHPNETATNTHFIHVPDPQGGTTYAVHVSPQAPNMSLKDVYQGTGVKLPDGVQSDFPISPDKFLDLRTSLLAKKLDQDNQMKLEQYKQSQENARSSASNATTLAAANVKNSPSAGATPGDSGFSPIAQGIVDGNLTPSQLSKRSKGSYDSVLGELSKNKIDFGQLQREEKFANAPATQNQVVAINTLDGHGNDPGVVAKLSAAMKAVNSSDIPALNQALSTGNRALGTNQSAGFQKALDLGIAVQDQYAKMLVGNGASSDAARAQAAKLFPTNLGANGLRGAVNAVKAEVDSRKNALVTQSRYLGKQLGVDVAQNATAGQSVNTPAAARPAIAEGATATNPQTGKKIQFKGGQWVPVQ
jgi:hypothetical protein